METGAIFGMFPVTRDERRDEKILREMSIADLARARVFMFGD